MDLEGIMLREISQTKTNIYPWNLKKPKLKKRVAWWLPEAVGGRGWRIRELLFKGANWQLIDK